MAKRSGNLDEFWIGLTVLLAFVILFGTIIWGKRISFKPRENEYIAEFQHVNGLSEGTSVVVHGVPKGKVRSITAGDTGAVVIFYLEPDITLKEDVHVSLIAPQLMGGRVVSVEPGISEIAWDRSKRLYGEVPSGVGEVMADVGRTMEKVQLLVADARSITSKIDSTLNRVKLEENLTQTLENLAETSKELRAELGSAAQSMNSGSSKISEAAGELQTLVGDNRVRLDSLILRLGNFTEDAEVFAKNLRKFSDDISDSTGTIGMLMSSDSLYYEILRTIADIDTAVGVIKEKGVKISIF